MAVAGCSECREPCPVCSSASLLNAHAPKWLCRCPSRRCAPSLRRTPSGSASSRPVSRWKEEHLTECCLRLCYGRWLHSLLEGSSLPVIPPSSLTLCPPPPFRGRGGGPPRAGGVLLPGRLQARQRAGAQALILRRGERGGAAEAGGAAAGGRHRPGAVSWSLEPSFGRAADAPSYMSAHRCPIDRGMDGRAAPALALAV